jgi:gluconate 2-dehydrogenase gamma chain
LVFFTEEEGLALEAMTARLIPSVDGMGALEAGAVYFMDRALAGPFREEADFFREGVRELMDLGFAGLSKAEQIRHLEGIEGTEFFEFARALTIIGTFSDPRYGGGREDAIHRIYAFPHAPGWEPPFGWYDAREAE